MNNKTDIKNNLNSKTVQLLKNRGLVTNEEIFSFLYPDVDLLQSPFDFTEMTKAVQLIKSTLKKNKKILVFGDYDCDGVGASAILYLALRNFNADVSVFIPSREEDGYGLNMESLKKAIEAYNPSLIITVDCGVQSIEEVAYLKYLGIDIIITDHHEPLEKLPDCIVINPKTQDNYKTELCGAGVAFKLVEALFGFEEAYKYIDICAISTIADLVPLKNDNRIIVKKGLEKINKGETRPGILEIIKLINEQNNARKNISTYDIAFRIAPRLNAVGRLSTAYVAFELLVSDCNQTIIDKAQILNIENKKRQDLCEKTISEAFEKLNNYDIPNSKIIVLYDQFWEAGIVGIVASKIAEEFNRPTIILTNQSDGLLRGSGRSIDGINLYEILSNNSQHLNSFGGHAMAAGLTLKDCDLENFVDACNEYISNLYKDNIFVPKTTYELELTIDELNINFSSELSLLEPFGIGNREPLFKIQVKKLSTTRIGKKPHMKCQVNKNFQMVFFNKIGYIGVLEEDIKKNLYFKIKEEEFRGNKYINAIVNEIEVVDFNISDETLTYNYFERFLNLDTGICVEKKQTLPNDFFGEIILVWTPKHFKIMSEKYPSYRKAYNILESLNPVNTILLAPSPSVNLSYFSKIIIADSSKALEYMGQKRYEMLNIDLEYIDLIDYYPLLPEITYEDVVLCYQYLKLYKDKSVFVDVNELYYSLPNKYTSMVSSNKFIICFTILLEICILIVKDEIISINQNCKPFESSKIYEFIKKTRELSLV